MTCYSNLIEIEAILYHFPAIIAYFPKIKQTFRIDLSSVCYDKSTYQF